MYYIYLLKSENKDFIYVGYTKDLKKRLSEHNKGSVRATRKHKPLNLVYYEAYISKKDALERERKLKHYGSSIGHLKKRIIYSLS